MNKTVKRVSAMLLAALLSASMLTACGGKTTSSAGSTGSTSSAETQTETKKDPVTLNVWMMNSQGTADAQVTEALNNLQSVKDLNLTINFTKTQAGSNYTQSVGLALAAEDPCDIVFDAAWITYNQRVAEGAYADITDEIEKHTALKEAIPEQNWNGVKIHDKIYCVPTYKEAATSWGFLLPTEILTKHNIEASSVKTLDDMTNVLKQAVADGRYGFMAYATGTTIARMAAAIQHDVITEYLTYVDYSDPTKVVNWYATEDFKKFAHLMRSWYEQGIIPENVATKDNYNDVSENSDLRGAEAHNYSPLNEVYTSKSYGIPFSYIPMADAYINTGTVAGSLYAVTSKCKYPDRAVDFLEAWNTKSEIKNMICYGLEGVTYDLVDGQVDTSKYPNHMQLWSAQNWSCGNEYISYTEVGEPKDKWEQYKAWNEAAKVSPLLGFAYDPSTTNSTITACKAAVTERLASLCNGLYEDVDAKIDELNQALEMNGMKELLADTQKQLDEFYATKK